jgi:hypothetical protein
MDPPPEEQPSGQGWDLPPHQQEAQFPADLALLAFPAQAEAAPSGQHTDASQSQGTTPGRKRRVRGDRCG